MVLLLLAATMGAAARACAEEFSFAGDIVPLLKTRCAACHLTGQEPGNLALHPGAAYASLVGVASVQLPSMQRIEAGAPERSYAMLKIEGAHLDAGGSGAQMPFAAPPLDDATREMFREWIRAGAPRNKIFRFMPGEDSRSAAQLTTRSPRS